MKKFARIASVIAMSVSLAVGGAIPNAHAFSSLSSGSILTEIPNVSTGTIGTSSDTTQLEVELLNLVNQHRIANGKAPARIDETLMKNSRDWSLTMGSTRNLVHSGQNVAENIYLSGWEGNAREIFEAWKNSPGHNKNMLGNYSQMGVGVVYRDGKTWATLQLYF